MLFYTFWEEICKYLSKMCKHDEESLDESIHDTQEAIISDVGLDLDEMGEELKEEPVKEEPVDEVVEEPVKHKPRILDLEIELEDLRDPPLLLELK